MNQQIRKIKNHFDANLDLYLIAGTGVVAGVVLHRAFAQPIRVVPPSDIIEAWAKGVVDAGRNIFLLDAKQTEMWLDCWEAAKSAA